MLIKRKEFSKKETDNKKEALGHAALGAANAYLAQGFVRDAIKSKGKGKLNNACAVLTTGNTAYHAYKAGSSLAKKKKDKE